MDINERVREIRNTLRLSQEEFAKGLKRSRSNIAKIESNDVGVTERLIDDIVTTYPINRAWLEEEKGEMIRKNNFQEELAFRCGQLIAGEDEFKKAIIMSYLEMDESYWLQLKKNIIDNLAKNKVDL